MHVNLYFLSSPCNNEYNGTNNYLLDRSCSIRENGKNVWKQCKKVPHWRWFLGFFTSNPTQPSRGFARPTQPNLIRPSERLLKLIWSAALGFTILDKCRAIELKNCQLWIAPVFLFIEIEPQYFLIISSAWRQNKFRCSKVFYKYSTRVRNWP